VKSIIFFGIIDILQKWNSKKKIAGFTKSLTNEKKELSTVRPIFYAQRFSDFLTSCLE